MWLMVDSPAVRIVIFVGAVHFDHPSSPNLRYTTARQPHAGRLTGGHGQRPRCESESSVFWSRRSVVGICLLEVD